MFKRLRNLFAPKRTGSWWAQQNRTRPDNPAPTPGPMALRRWDAADTNRLNSKHWYPVTGSTINVDLSSRLETLRTRVEYELGNNSDAEGAVNTHIVDVIGENGPALQVQSENVEYNEKLERLWEKWWAKPDINGKLAGADMLQLWWRSLWSAGEYLAQIIVDDDAKGPVKMRLLVLHARRLATPAVEAGDSTIFMGVKRNKLGKPLEYMISAPPDRILPGQLPTDFDTVPADDIIHEFRVLEAGQVRGLPWLVTGLQPIADMRDFDNEVLDAARAAADNGAVMVTNHPDSQFVEINETTEVERRTLTALPPGYDMKQMIPQQPATGYLDYHDEQLRKIGHPVGMPLMMIKLDSRKHNYSSARFDGQIYERASKTLRAWMARTTLNRLVELVAMEARVGKKLSEAPEDVHYHWEWPPFPHVDPAKEAKAATERLKNGTSTLRAECEGDWEEIQEQQAIEQRKRGKLGLTPLSEMLGVSAEPEPEEPDEEKTSNAKPD